jgi:hypothetical protein
MRLLPRLGRFNAKREVWPGGPQVGQVIEAQLNPPASVASGAATAELAEEPPAQDDTRAVQLLLLLR